MKRLLLLILLIPQVAFADRSFYSTYSIGSPAIAQGLIIPAAVGGSNLGSNAIPFKRIIGGDAAWDADITSTLTGLYLATNGDNSSQVNFVSLAYAANAIGAENYYLKTRAAGATNANTIVVSGDQIAAFRFYGADGADFRKAAEILAVVDGTPGASDMPGRLVFSVTADGAASATEALRIENDGDLLLAQRLTSSRTSDIGWVPVDGANNTACNSVCTSACVFGFGLTGDTAFPITSFESCASAVSDICFCAGSS